MGSGNPSALRAARSNVNVETEGEARMVTKVDISELDAADLESNCDGAVDLFDDPLA